MLGRVIISASRRTDIPRHFAPWFARRRAAGFAEYRTAYGVHGRVSLRPEDVTGYVFWTRDARPLRGELERLRAEGVPCAFQWTLNGYGSDLEPRRPPTADAIDALLEVSDNLPAPTAIQWRYDPIVLSDRYPYGWHVDTFGSLAEKLAGATTVCNVSVIEPFAKTLRRVTDPTVRYRQPDAKRHRKACELPVLVASDGPALVAELATLGRQFGIQVRSCCDARLPVASSACIGADLFAAYSIDLGAVPSAPTRDACRCLRSIDIGVANTCPAGCRYCYVVTSDESVNRNLVRHDSEGASIA